MNMTRINSISHKFYSVIYLLIIAMIGVFCALNATYDVMIGGTPFYFFAVLVLALQSIFALRESERSRNIAGLGLIVLVMGLVYSYGFMFLTHLKAIVLLPSICLTLFGLPSISQHPQKAYLLKTVLLISLIALAAIQYYELSMLKGYYDSLPNNGSWQKYGGL
ncbi:hypothetical protein D7V21_01150 [Acinetobacter guerrae]|uniref:Uncharacterized protein n=1 Tax=Acinetobacter guerrae TaxID=1843371 RepID=A0A3A8EZQ8_9GAMM|nr:hypothetical protein [Acinetobacter guerrae]RKG36230.1 hypothetical protein D7V21_01150 [Acinetobacter guerrae]